MSDTVNQPAGTDVVVTRSVPISVKSFWKALVTKEGSEILLGTGGELGDKGDSWKAEDGSFGVIRSYHPLERLRFSWHAKEGSTKTMVILTIIGSGDGSAVQIVHTDVPDYYNKESLQERWGQAIDGIAVLAA